MMLRRSWLALTVLAAALTLGQPAARALETKAEEAIVLDHTTGEVLYAKHPDRRIPPASMSKMMTAYVVFDRIRNGDLSLDDTFTISEKAWRKGGSKMFVEVGNEVSVENLLKGMIVQSGNDASIALAEGVAGTEEAFAQLMTRKAREIGVDKSTFQNATGWPDPDHRVTVRGLAQIARHIIEDFPKLYEFFSQREFSWNGIRQFNRNPLLGRGMGVDGLKTGHTQNAGYGLTASAERDGRRLIVVVAGLDRPSGRENEAARLLKWGFREFGTYTLFAKGETVEKARLWLGTEGSVPLVTRKDVKMTLPRDKREELTATVIYDSPVPAPVEKGERLATLRLEAPDKDTTTIPLVAARSVDQLGPVGRLAGGLQFLLFGPPTPETK
ncbi:D-alanyl-D-alanine carboxypeptidase (penicillin-binding protein 5/6) [Limimonas halophila]|uniref:serine-type D-Ala-D-Ala carboxypeptidase n=1 Tax=Limimonas halophila TaxID=1082479 RepID=A0A1G7NKC0_9PROT|nr:D-alanyl-D-alanine carboxypeptidase family protein [Limimonas halophila]SDF74498.1 D-alanyl-D-alanine carboxypeptidase (penicillin-binding protein 5/6) [Limimonas halophila]